MGYVMVSARGDINPELVDALPNLRGNTHELRQWSVRTSLYYTPPTSDPEKSEIQLKKPLETASQATNAAWEECGAGPAPAFPGLWEAFDWKCNAPGENPGEEWFYTEF
jgi:hypothetical protein